MSASFYTLPVRLNEPCHLRPLLRTTAELCHRSHRVKQHLQSIQNLGETQYDKIATTITRKLNNAEQEPIQQALREKESISPTKMSPNDIAEALFLQLNHFAHRFTQLHETLVHLPVYDVYPETIDCLKIGFGEQYDHIKPSTILGTLFNAYEFDFLARLNKYLLPVPKVQWPSDEKNIALQLPVCDRKCPTAWPVLAHEMGHAIDNEYKISTTVANSHSFFPKSGLENYAQI